MADDGKTVQKNVEAYDAAWSPNGNYFLTTNDSNTQVFDSSLNPIAVVPNNNVNSPLWLTNDTLLYMINNQVWEYSVSTGTSEIVAATPANRGIVDAALSPDASYVYLAVQDKPGSNDSYSLLRVAFKGQSANTNTIQKLQPQFPWLLGSCYLQLINYGTPPAVLVTDSSTSSVPVDCSGLAQTYVQQFGVDPSQLQYVNSDLSIDQSISQ